MSSNLSFFQIVEAWNYDVDTLILNLTKLLLKLSILFLKPNQILIDRIS